jgi:spore coat protein U-like protein
VPPNATLLLIAIAFIALAVSSPALAQSCSVTNASGSYGSINVLSGAAVDTTSTFTVTCSGKKNNTVRLCIEMSAGSPTDAGKRALSNGAKFLDHEFYSDASRTQVWGSWGAVVTAYGSGGVTYDLLLNSSGSVSHIFTLYARVLANQQAAAPLAYSWTAISPGTKYGYLGSAVCPTGGGSTMAEARFGPPPWLRTAPYPRLA